MKALYTLIALLTLSAPLYGQSVVLQGLKPNTTYTLSVDATGAVTLSEAQVVTPGSSSTPVTPAPAPQSNLTKLVKQHVAATGDKETAAQLAPFYFASVKGIKAGKYKTAQEAVDQLDKSLKAVLTITGKLQQWDPLFVNIKNELNARVDAGKITNVADVAVVYSEIGNALQDNGNALDIAALFQIISQLLSGDGIDRDFIGLVLQVVLGLFD